MTFHHGIRNADIYRALQRAIDEADLNDGSNDCYLGLHLPFVQGTVVRIICRDHDQTLGTCNLRTGSIHWRVDRCPQHPDEVA